MGYPDTAFYSCEPSPCTVNGGTMNCGSEPEAITITSRRLESEEEDSDVDEERQHDDDTDTVFYRAASDGDNVVASVPLDKCTVAASTLGAASNCVLTKFDAASYIQCDNGITAKCYQPETFSLTGSYTIPFEREVSIEDDGDSEGGSKKVSPGVIAAAVLVPLLVVGAAIGVVVVLKKRKHRSDGLTIHNANTMKEDKDPGL